ncbi:dihydroneopterin aldolase [Tersicoccus phoenicis]|uniref:7,8-dihydroneopterin aldolase n=1 Tax=Tersicoccus phoenicis TaxID=554083 RepID=A0A1R1LD86_9MICC|nr:dihydroneopterin aldolase [Tersicoccus phoenicis]OMH25488.1 dihydroneopterin aldolase [Tersicoccus phoenicis]
MDLITLSGIRGRGTHGVLDAERQLGQVFTADVVLELDLTAAGRDDDLTRTVNYAEAAERVHARLTGPPVALIETLTATIAEDLLAAYPLDAVTVTVHKPAAPIPVPFDDVAVTMRRERR